MADPLVLALRSDDAAGAGTDSSAANTAALQAALDAAGRAGGGTVHVPPGRFAIRPLTLRDRTTLHLDAGCVLRGSTDPADYPLIDSNWEGAHRIVHQPLIYGRGLTGAALTGRGTIDGQGAPWWAMIRERRCPHPRPRLIAFEDCTDLLIQGLRLIDSPSWTVHPLRCTRVRIDGLTLCNPPDAPNTDGINPDSCQSVSITDCHVDVGDDCITIKSGTEALPPELRLPCADLIVTGCHLRSGHGGVVIGSEMSGGVQRVVVSSCIMTGTDRGIRIKTRRGRGGCVEDLLISDVIMDDVGCPLVAHAFYRYGTPAGLEGAVRDPAARAVDAGTPRIRGLHLRNVVAHRARWAAGFLLGLPESPIEDVVLSGVRIDTIARHGAPRDADEPAMTHEARICRGEGFIARHVRGLDLRDAHIRAAVGADLDVIGCELVR